MTAKQRIWSHVSDSRILIAADDPIAQVSRRT